MLCYGLKMGRKNTYLFLLGFVCEKPKKFIRNWDKVIPLCGGEKGKMVGGGQRQIGPDCLYILCFSF